MNIAISKRRYRPAFIIVALLVIQVQSVHAFIVDLSSQMVAITSGFKGSSFSVFGSKRQAEDVLIVISGPEETRRIFRKRKIRGVWANADSMTFKRVPSFYKMVASRPLEQLLPKKSIRHYQMGMGGHYLTVIDKSSPELDVKQYKNAMIREGIRKDIYNQLPIALSVQKDGFFKAQVHIPSHVPRGVYWVQAYQIQDGRIINAETLPFVVDQVGIGAYFGKLARDKSFLYALLAVLMAITAGWGANLIFKRK